MLRRKCAILLFGSALILLYSGANVPNIYNLLCEPAGRWLVGLLVGGLVLYGGSHVLVDPWRAVAQRRQLAALGIDSRERALRIRHAGRRVAGRRAGNLRTLLRAVSASGGIGAAYGIAQYFGWDPLLPSKRITLVKGVPDRAAAGHVGARRLFRGLAGGDRLSCAGAGAAGERTLAPVHGDLGVRAGRPGNHIERNPFGHVGSPCGRNRVRDSRALSDSCPRFDQPASRACGVGAVFLFASRFEAASAPALVARRCARRCTAAALAAIRCA